VKFTDFIKRSTPWQLWSVHQGIERLERKFDIMLHQVLQGQRAMAIDIGQELEQLRTNVVNLENTQQAVRTTFLQWIELQDRAISEGDLQALRDLNARFKNEVDEITADVLAHTPVDPALEDEEEDMEEEEDTEESVPPNPNP
jgi:hypothetical protein